MVSVIEMVTQSLGLTYMDTKMRFMTFLRSLKDIKAMIKRRINRTCLMNLDLEYTKTVCC